MDAPENVASAHTLDAAGAPYLKLKEISDSMRDAALCGNWDEFIELGKTYTEAFSAVSAAAHEKDLSDDVRHARARVLIHILDNDTLIRELVTPELTRVSAMLSRANRNRTAIKAYYEQNVASVSS